MTPLEKYQAYRISGGLSETPATVTRPQSYNIRSGGVSQAEKTNIQRIKDRQAADKEANRIQQEKYWNLNLSKGTPKQEPTKYFNARERARLATETGIEMGDLNEFLDIPTGLNRSTKFGGFSSKAEQQAALAKAITQSQTEHTGAWMKIHSTQETELPLAAESPVKQNDFLPPSETSEQIFEIPPINSGRIELNPSLPEQKTASTPAKSDNSKYFVIGGIAIAALVLFLILRRRK